MNSRILLGRRIYGGYVRLRSVSVCMYNSGNMKDGGEKNGHALSEEILKESFERLDFDSDLHWKPVLDEPEETDYNDKSDFRGYISSRQRFFATVRLEADRVLDILLQDGPGFDSKLALDELGATLLSQLVQEVLTGILKSVNHTNKNWCAKLGYKFFSWSAQQENYKHNLNAYHLIMKIFADCEEFKAMWKLVDEMTENGYPTMALTFNILISTCGEAGIVRKLVERFIKSKTFNYRPFKHSFNAILHSLLVISQYKLIEWVYQQKLLEGLSPDTNIQFAFECKV